jgi:L-alanine-DL-glutamate epimerase-like enolase superfamily enzyme
MAKQGNLVSRRGFFGASAAGAAVGFSAVADPAAAAAQAAGVKRSDLPDLTIKEVKTYVLKNESPAGGPAGARAAQEARLFSVVTNGGIEGNYSVGRGDSAGLREYAKELLVGQNAIYGPSFTSIWDPTRRRHANTPYAASIDYVLWDIVGKAVNLPVYKILGPYRDKVLAYASSQHLSTVEAFVEDVKRAKSEGYKGYKIHPPWVPTSSGGAQMGAPTTKVPNQGLLNLPGVDLDLDIEVAKAVRATGGPHMGMILDRVGAYTREQALKMGRVLDQLNYNGFEDPLPSVDLEGCVQLCRDIDTPVHMGELFSSMYEFPPFIRERGMDVLRFIGGYIGGITGGMKLAKTAEVFGMECVPHNWGDPFEHAVHFHMELAMPNNIWFEMMQPTGSSYRPYIVDKFRIDKDGFVPAPTKPGLGLELDRAAIDKMLIRMET